jgi:hypothetical protein
VSSNNAARTQQPHESSDFLIAGHLSTQPCKFAMKRPLAVTAVQHGRFRELAAKRTIGSRWSQKEVNRAFQELSIGIQLVITKPN